MLDLLLKELCKQIIRKDDYNKILYTVEQIFTNHRQEIYPFCYDENIKEKILTLFRYPVIFDSVADIAARIIMIYFDEEMEKDLEYMERFL